MPYEPDTDLMAYGRQLFLRAATIYFMKKKVLHVFYDTASFHDVAVDELKSTGKASAMCIK